MCLLGNHKLCNTRALFKTDDVNSDEDDDDGDDGDVGKCCHKHLWVWRVAFVVRHGSSKEQQQQQHLKLFQLTQKKIKTMKKMWKILLAARKTILQKRYASNAWAATSDRKLSIQTVCMYVCVCVCVWLYGLVANIVTAT